MALTPTRRSVLRGAGGLLLAAASPRPVRAKTVATTVPLRLGAWTQGMDANPSLLDAWGSLTGSSPSVASIFRGRGDLWPSALDSQLTKDGSRVLLVSWHLEDWGSYQWWASGAGDSVLQEQAARLKAYGKPVVVRPWAEMNGDWAPHQPLLTGPQKLAGGTPGEFVAAWRRVVTTFRSQGVTTVKFCLNPTTDTYQECTPVAALWPGASYVDLLGLDGYNWGGGNGLTWRSFDDIYRQQYANLVALKPGAPLWICEVSSADPRGASGVSVTAPPGATKGSWWAALNSSLKAGYPQVQALVAFDALKERDWRVNSSSEALQGFRSLVASPPRRPSPLL